MSRTRCRAGAGLLAAMVVTMLFAGAVAAPAVLTHELADDDGCAPTDAADDRATAPTDRLADLTGALVECLASDGDAVAAGGPRMK